MSYAKYSGIAGSGSGSAVTTVGTLDGGSTSANGASISSNTIYMQSASASFPGLVNTTTQTMAGAKTFSTSISSPSWKLTGATSGTLSMLAAAVTSSYTITWPNAQGGVDTFLKNDGSGGLSWAAGTGSSGVDTVGTYDSQAASADGATIVGTTIYFQSADATHPGMISTGTQTMAGAKTFSTSLTSPIFSTSSANPASAGTIRLANTNLIEWRNAANSGNKTITLDVSDIFQFTSPINSSGNITGANLSGTNTGDQTITLTGDVTGSGTGSFAATLATVNSNVGTFGSSTSIPTVTVNAKGLVTAASGNAVIAPAGTLTGTTLASNVVTSSLTAVGTIGTGTWQGTKVAEAYGGTNQSTYTTGDIIYASASNTLSKLAIGSTNDVLTVSGGVPSWQAASASSLSAQSDLLSCGLVTSVGSNALTIDLKNNAGNDPSSGNPVKFSFGSTTITTGSYSLVSYTAATTITVSSGATLGLTDNAEGYIYVLACYDGTNKDLGVCGSRRFLDEGKLYNTTVMNSSADDFQTIYTTTARTGVRIRVIGRLRLTETTAGTYASNVTAIELFQGAMWSDIEYDVSDTGFSGTGMGTITNKHVYRRRVGNYMYVNGSWSGGTVAATTASITFPSGFTIDSDIIVDFTREFGTSTQFNTSSNVYNYNNTGIHKLFWDTATNDRVFVAYLYTTAGFQKSNANDFMASDKTYTFNFAVPIKEYRSY